MLRFLIFMVGFIAAGASAAEDVTPCPADILQYQHMSITEKGPVRMLPSFRVGMGAKASDFIVPVGGIMEHIATRLAQEKLCTSIAQNKDRSLLQFVSWTLFAFESSSPTPVLLVNAGSSRGCRITSPWLDLAFERKPVPQIRGIVRWNERQLLADQAILAGAKSVLPGEAMPLKSSELRHFAQDYAASEINGERMAKPVEERIPPDLLWLFRHSPQKMTLETFSSPFTVGLDRTREKGSVGYRRLVIALIDRCFDSNGETLHYDNILDAKDLIPLEEYKIETLTD
ncbi:MAG: hypothetical protein LBV44_04965 [Methylobacillus sp.]|jgi:hypothetical protein|nr:hypothetical protein [Methylobacillus sp.]